MLWITLFYILGILTGVGLSLVVTANRKVIIRMVDWTDEKLSFTGDQEVGAVFLPKSDLETAQDNIMAYNATKGKDTPLEEIT